MRGAVGFGKCYGPERYYSFRGKIWKNPFRVILRAAKKHMVGAIWDAHRTNAYNSTRNNPPADEDYILYVVAVLKS